MIALLIRWSVANRFLVLLATLFVVAWGLWSVQNTPVDALPDLSDVQVIIRTPYPGQAPQIVENQVTYPMTTTMLSVPGAKTVRGFSFFGDSYVYVLFDEGTDLYWARSRVLEYPSQLQARFDARQTDGYVVLPAELGSTLDGLFDQVIPTLQARGLLRSTYHGKTLRDHLDLPLPQWQPPVQGTI